MPRKKPTQRACTHCSTPTDKPRKGLCYRCYLRRWRGHTIEGPCAVCGGADRRMLRRHQLADGRVVLCANHAALAGRRKLTLAELAAECFSAGDRRRADRRGGDRRTGLERRRRVDVDWLLDGDRRQAGRRAADAAQSAI